MVLEVGDNLKECILAFIAIITPCIGYYLGFKRGKRDVNKK